MSYSDESGARRLRVALVEMPFGPVAWPSIGTSLLKSQLRRAGHDCEVIYFNHDFMARLGPAGQETLGVYHSISDAFGIHLGDWVFAEEAHPRSPDLPRLDREFLDRLRASDEYAPLAGPAARLRALAGPYLDDCLGARDWSQFDVVGFANSYSQLNASLALAARLRLSNPSLPLVIGGCGCSDVMGVAVLKLSPAFRAAALGEADEIIADLALAVSLDSDELLARIPGVAYRTADGRVEKGPPKSRVTDVDGLPHPDYDDYFTYRHEALADFLPFYIPVESSRGCWWGAKVHCTFCGLNPDRMAFYRKEPDRFLGEVASLSERYRPRRFMAVDNIMPHDYYADVLPRLSAASRGAEFFFEVKANFQRHQLEVFRDANVRQIQPGIESLSSNVLRLMGKGINAISNIHTLRMCQEFGLRAHWSILYGFAGESAEDYELTAQLIARIRHLRPPLGVVQVEVERFAPMFRFPEQHGLTNLRPSSWYGYSFPVEDGLLRDLAYRFDADYLTGRDELSRRISEEIGRAVAEWRESYDEGRCAVTQDEAGGIITVSRRDGALTTEYVLDERVTALYRELDRPRHLAKLAPRLGRPAGYEPYLDETFRARALRLSAEGGRRHLLSAACAEEAYELLLLHGLVIEEGGMAVGVACHPGLSGEPD